MPEINSPGMSITITFGQPVSGGGVGSLAGSSGGIDLGLGDPQSMHKHRGHSGHYMHPPLVQLLEQLLSALTSAVQGGGLGQPGTAAASGAAGAGGGAASANPGISGVGQASPPQDVSAAGGADDDSDFGMGDTNDSAKNLLKQLLALLEGQGLEGAGDDDGNDGYTSPFSQGGGCGQPTVVPPPAPAWAPQPQSRVAQSSDSGPPGVGAGSKVSASAPGGGTGITSSYGAGPDSYIMSEKDRDARYYNGPPNDKSFYGNSTNVNTSQVAHDIMQSVKANWGSVDPAVKAKFDNGECDSFFGPNADKVKGLEGWQKAGLYELEKTAFETAGTLDPNHTDPGDQAWGGFSLYNKGKDWKDYGLSTDLRGPEGKAALTSPGFGVIADLNTLPVSVQYYQDNHPGDNSMGWLDQGHFTFVGNAKDYDSQKAASYRNGFDQGTDTAKNIGTTSLLDYVKSFG